MRLAMVNADRGIAPGSTKGAALHLRGLTHRLRRMGHDVELYSARSPEGPFPVPVRPLTDLGPERVATTDAVYERYSVGHAAGLELAREAGRPFVLEVNAPLVDEAIAHRRSTVDALDGAIERILLVEADLVVTVSSVLSEWVLTRRSGPTVTVSNGFEPAWFTSHPPPEVVWDLVFLGHPKPWHGADRLVPLLVDLGRRHHSATLLVIGGGPGADRLRRDAERSGVAERITVTGAVSPAEAARLVRSARIGVAPYPRLDPFYFCPLKLLDYMAAGLPVVATEQGDIGRIVGEAGILVDPDDHDGLVTAVDRLLASTDERRRLGELGRGRANARFTWDHTAAATTDAIAAVVRGRREVIGK